jgi:hypothetical protein
MAKRWASHGETVFFFPVFGNRGTHLQEDISSILGGGSGWDEIRAIAEKGGQKWIIILDGAENTTNPEEFFQGVAEFANRYKNSARILVSLKDLHYHLWEKYLEKKIAQNGSAPAIKELIMPVALDSPLIEPCPTYFRLSNFTMAELEDAYRTISSHYTVAPLSPFSSFSRNIKGMIRNPALLHIFLTCLKNREVPNAVGLSDLMESLVLSQINFAKQRRESLEHFIEILLSSKSTHLTLDALVDNGTPLLVHESLVYTIFSSLLELLREGILGRSCLQSQDKKEIFLYFPSSILGQYLVYRTLALSGKHRDEILVENAKELVDGNQAIYGLLYFALLRLANKQHFDRLVKVLKESASTKHFMRHILYSILVFKEETSSGRVGDGFNSKIFSILRAFWAATIAFSRTSNGTWFSTSRRRATRGHG